MKKYICFAVRMFINIFFALAVLEYMSDSVNMFLLAGMFYLLGDSVISNRKEP